MKAIRRQFSTAPEVREEHENSDEVSNTLEGDEIKQIYREKGAEGTLEETLDDEAAEEEEDDELDEEDEVVRAAQRNL
jgi:hypothetical protein